MFNSTYKFTLLLLFVSGLVAAPTFATGLPNGFPSIGEYHNLGTVDSIEKYKSRIVVNDQEYILPNNVVVHTSNNNIGSLRNVRTGKSVGVFTTGGSNTSLSNISEIWVFPRGYTIDKNSIRREDN